MCGVGRCEIEATLDRLKKLERDLSSKEKELKERERRLKIWERKLIDQSNTPVSHPSTAPRHPPPHSNTSPTSTQRHLTHLHTAPRHAPPHSPPTHLSESGHQTAALLHLCSPVLRFTLSVWSLASHRGNTETFLPDWWGMDELNKA